MDAASEWELPGVAEIDFRIKVFEALWRVERFDRYAANRCGWDLARRRRSVFLFPALKRGTVRDGRHAQSSLPLIRRNHSAFHNHRDGVAATQTKRDQAVAKVSLLQCVQQGHEDPGTGGANGMTQGNRA